MANALVALQIARTLLNDDQQATWTDAVLMPKLQQAHRELQISLFLVGLPVVKEVSSIFTVTAGSLDLGANQPADLVEPIRLMERGVGEADNLFIDMVEQAFIPHVTLTNRLIYWVWLMEKITFLGSTVTREVIVYYKRGITIPTTKTDSLGFIHGESFIGPRLAAMAAGSVGNDAIRQICQDQADNNLSIVERANVKGMQSLPARRIPFRRAGRRTII